MIKEERQPVVYISQDERLKQIASILKERGYTYHGTLYVNESLNIQTWIGRELLLLRCYAGSGVQVYVNLIETPDFAKELDALTERLELAERSRK